MKNFFRAVCRILVGLTFIVSGFFKAVDPVGFELKIKEYLNVFHLSFFDFSALFVAILFCSLEFLIGVAILKGIKMKLFSFVALIFISFFTLLTFISLLFTPVQDCGCFGEIIHLTNLQTFLKNIILLFAIVFIFFQRDNFKKIASNRWELIYIAFYSIFILIITIYSIVFHPLVDFGLYKSGTNISSLAGEVQRRNYEAVFIYEKEGVKREFDLDNLPDSTWTYLDTKTVLIDSDSISAQTANFILKNDSNEYITSQVLDSEKPLFLLSIYNPAEISERDIAHINELCAAISSKDGVLYCVSANSFEETGHIAKKIVPSFLYSDYKTVISLNRINGGLTYIDRGVVINKWGKFNSGKDKILKIISNDSQVFTAEVVIRERLFLEISLIVIIFMVTIIRYVSKIIYYRAERKNDSEDNAPCSGN